MRIRFTELAEAILRRLVEPDRQPPPLGVHLHFYLRRDHEVTAVRLDVFDDVELFLYAFSGSFRVMSKRREHAILVGSFTMAGSE